MIIINVIVIQFSLVNAGGKTTQIHTSHSAQKLFFHRYEQQVSLSSQFAPAGDALCRDGQWQIIHVMQPEGAHAWGQTKTVSPSIRKSNENTRGNYTCVLIVNMVRHTENAPGHALHLTTATSQSGSAMFSLKCPVCVSSPLSNAHDLCATLDRFYRP